MASKRGGGPPRDFEGPSAKRKRIAENVRGILLATGLATLLRAPSTDNDPRPGPSREHNEEQQENPTVSNATESPERMFVEFDRDETITGDFEDVDLSSDLNYEDDNVSSSSSTYISQNSSRTESTEVSFSLSNSSSNDEDAFGSCENEGNSTFKEKLASWVVDNQIKQVHVDKLLDILKCVPGYDSLKLPNSCRTLVKTLRRTPVRDCLPGHYYHFGILQAISSFLDSIKLRIFKGDKLKLFINIDGVPIAKSTGSQFWPVLGLLKGFPNASPFLIGIYHGYKKPDCANNFLTDLIQDMLRVNETGIVYKGKTLFLDFLGFICDAPAKAFITCIKLHNAYFGCSKCTVEGDWEGRIVFLEDDAPLRNDNSFRSKENEDHHSGTSDLELLPIDMVSHFPIDYFHLVCLGVVKKLLLAWIKGPFRARIGKRGIDSISKRLLGLKSFIPRDFARKPRSVAEVLRWKGTEFRQFLLYSGPVVLKNILRKKYYDHFMLLHVAIKILVTKKICLQFCDYAESLLLRFVRLVPSLYGREFMTYNFHNLVHLASQVREVGKNLDYFSAFPFENYLNSVKK